MAGSVELFASRARDYAEFRPRYPPELAAIVAEASRGRALAIDCGCGSGQFSLLLAAHFPRVVACDASAAQIRHAAPHPRVDYVVAASEQMPLCPRSADLVTAAQAAHWFDLDRFWHEARTVTRSQGVVALVGYGLPHVDGAVDAVIRTFHDDVLGPYWPKGRHLVVRGYAALDFPFRRLPTPALEMRSEWTLSEFLGYLRTWSAVTQAERATGRSPLPPVAAEIAARWGPSAQQRTVVWPIWLKLGLVS